MLSPSEIKVSNDTEYKRRFMLNNELRSLDSPIKMAAAGIKTKFP